MGIIALVGFWLGIVFLWIEDGPKIPIILIILWLLGMFVLPIFKLGAFFWPYEAILAIFAILIWKAKSVL